MADSPNYPSCIAKNFVQDGKQYKGRVDLFLDKFYGEKKFLTEVGLVDVFFCIITIKRDTYEFDASFSEERSEFLARWEETSGVKPSESKLEFKVGIKGVVKDQMIPLTRFKKTEDIFGGAGGSSGVKVNKGLVFEQQFFADANKVLVGEDTGSRFQSFIKQFNEKIQKEKKLAISNIEAIGSSGQNGKFSGVLDEGSKNQSRPLKLSGSGLVVSAGGETKLDIGSTITDITFQYGEKKLPVYLSLKFGPTLTFFNSGVGGRNGPLLFTEKEIKDYKITTTGGLTFLKMFGIDDKSNMNKFCESFVDYPRSKPIQGYKVPVKGNKTAIQKLLQSGIGYGYHMIHNTSGNTIDAYEINKTYMTEASKIIGNITVYFGRMNGKGKGVNITCESKHYNFIFNIRNKQGKLFPSHVMCDYKKKKTPTERSEKG